VCSKVCEIQCSMHSRQLGGNVKHCHMTTLSSRLLCFYPLDGNVTVQCCWIYLLELKPVFSLSHTTCDSYVAVNYRSTSSIFLFGVLLEVY